MEAVDRLWLAISRYSSIFLVLAQAHQLDLVIVTLGSVLDSTALEAYKPCLKIELK